MRNEWPRVLISTLLLVTMGVDYGINGKENKCLSDLTKNRRRWRGKENNNVPITIELTESVSQNILSWIMNIYLYEVLGYDNIVMRSTGGQFKLNSTLENMKTVRMVISVEVWIPSEFREQEIYNRSTRPNHNPNELYIGPFEQIGRIGRFVPARFSEFNNWMLFKNSTFSSSLVLDDDVTSILDKSTVDCVLDIPSKYNTSGSKNGTYIPRRCQNKNSNCVKMLTNDVRITDVIELIEEFQLHIEVYCVGDNLNDVVELLLQSDTEFFFILRHWVPSELVSIPRKGLFSPMELPSDDRKPYLKEQSLSLKTMFSDDVIHSATPVLKIFNNSTLLGRYYAELNDTLIAYAKNSKAYDVACDWLKKYLADSQQNPEKLTVGGIQQAHQYQDDENLRKIVKFVEETVNQQNLIKHYVLKFAPKTFINNLKAYEVVLFHKDLYKSPYIMGPAWSNRPKRTIAASNHRTIIVYNDYHAFYEQLKRTPNYFLILGSGKIISYLRMKFFQHFKWNRVATQGDTFNEWMGHLRSFSIEHNIIEIFSSMTHVNGKFEEMKKFLLEMAAKKAKIILVDTNSEMIYRLICTAAHLNMTAERGYVWVLPHWLKPNWWEKACNELGEKLPENMSCTPDELFNAMNGYFSLGPAAFGPDDQMIPENITIRQWRDRFQESTQSKEAGFLHDACWTYVYAIKRFMNESHDALNIINGKGAARFADIIGETDFLGLSGRVQFNGGNVRVNDYVVTQFINGTFNTVARLYVNRLGGGSSIVGSNFIINDSAIIWLSKHIPDDGGDPPAHCVFNTLAKGLKVSCEVAVVIVSLTVLVLLAIIFSLSFKHLKKRCDLKVRLHEELMKSRGLLRKDGGSDEWVIPRNRITLNRKIGEGAFGMVYGGEVLLPEQDWVPVAVKTLKAGSPSDEECNFLMEAEVMKRFDHPNIVQLLGVCLNSEPVLTIIEFMLYGDLKTYLLSRRRLVKRPGHEVSDEIGHKRLTEMALDVVRALHYLDQLKYVHRDVASRNCLVNAERVVKLGDFGMTRSVYECDFDRKVQKGKFPIRWMAPESLSTGHFSSASDIWSFGILLYEIITFGKTPYAGNTNKEVMEHVKSGNTMFIPSRVKPTLKNLMISCWNMDYLKRPTALQITSILLMNPCLLEPYLDAPVLHVTEQMDFTLPEETERRAYVKWPNPSSNANEPSTRLLTDTQMQLGETLDTSNFRIKFNAPNGIELSNTYQQ